MHKCVSDSQIFAWTSPCLEEIFSDMTYCKTDLLYIPGDAAPCQDLVFSLDSYSKITPPDTAHNLEVDVDNYLPFLLPIAKLTQSCRFLLYYNLPMNPVILIHRGHSGTCSLPCHSLSCHVTPRLVFNLPKFSHLTPLLHSLHRFPVCIRFKTLMLTYKG